MQLPKAYYMDTVEVFVVTPARSFIKRRNYNFDHVSLHCCFDHKPLTATATGSV